MKKVYKWSVLIPMAFILYIFINPFKLCIPQIGVYWEVAMTWFFFILPTVLWLCCSPFRKSCCNGTITELLFNALPIELGLLTVFSQWHFVLALFFAVALLVVEVMIFVRLKKEEHKHRITKKRRAITRAVFQRCTVLAVATCCFLPGILSLFVYGFQSPTYKADQTKWEKMMTSHKAAAPSSPIAKDDLYAQNADLWQCFETNSWNELKVGERITVMQRLVDFECKKLGVPTVPVEAGMIGYFTLGAYDNEKNQMYINTEHLANSSEKDCIQTICHETYHSMQWYLVSTLDWENPALKSAYFDQVRVWRENEDSYKSAWKFGFDAYENQPLEATAREYAEKESAVIMNYVRNPRDS